LECKKARNQGDSSAKSSSQISPNVASRIHTVDVSPPPKCEAREKRKCKSQSAEVITSSPYKKQVEDKVHREKTSVTRKRTAKIKNQNKSTQKVVHGSNADVTPCGTRAVQYCDDARLGIIMPAKDLMNLDQEHFSAFCVMMTKQIDNDAVLCCCFSVGYSFTPDIT